MELNAFFVVQNCSHYISKSEFSVLLVLQCCNFGPKDFLQRK